MANTSPIAACPRTTDHGSSSGQTIIVIDASASARRKPQGRPSSTKWVELKPIIHRLYITEEKTLKEVAEILKTEYAFGPTERSCKRWIAAWGWRKNIQINQLRDDGALCTALESRHQLEYHQRSAHKRSVRLANGHCVDVDRLAEYMRRKKGRTFGAARQGFHLEHEYVAMSRGVDLPQDLRVCEMVLVQTQNYTQARHNSSITSIRAQAKLLVKHRDCAVRWLGFVGGIKDALKQGLNDTLALRMRQAPDQLASMIRLQPSSLLCSLYMFILQTSVHMSTKMSDDDDAQLRAVVKSLMNYGATVAQSMGLPDNHPLPQLLRYIPMVPENDLGELVFRSWGMTSQSWGMVSMQGILDSDIAAKCSENWANGGEQGNIMVGPKNKESPSRAEQNSQHLQQTYTMDVLNECQKKCESQYGLEDERSIRTLLGKAELNEVMATENGLDCYQVPVIADIYQEIMHRAVDNEPAKALAMRFFKERSETEGEDWEKDVADVGEGVSAVPYSTAQLYMHVLHNSLK